MRSNESSQKHLIAPKILFTYFFQSVMPLGVEVTAGGEVKTFDTRSFIMSRPQVGESPVGNQQQVLSAVPRTVQTRFVCLYFY